MNVEGTANAVSAFAIAAFLGAVIWNGKLTELVGEVGKEVGFVEFLVAAYILYLLANSRSVGSVAAPFITMAVIAALLRLAASTNAQSALSEFAQGKAGLAQTVGKVFGA